VPPWGTPVSCLNSLDKVLVVLGIYGYQDNFDNNTGKCRNSTIFKISQYAIFPSHIVCLFEIKENCNYILFMCECITNV